ncbi:MAG: FKBP-type peptidyl-prolyl cis-trans isomerase [Paludibacteraceae bacterium]|nr:FKBP-type peptidyl-prolyl cis-trans isomerase [Paludibacteraceae bacterium]
MKEISYALGLNIGNNLLGAGVKQLELNTFLKGVQDALESKPQDMTNQEAQAILNDYFTKLQEQQSEGKIKEGAEFLAENAKREGVTTLPSGLQYEVLVAGNGAKPTSAQSVKCHYHGTLIDGTVFDSSVLRGEPATFGVGQVIKGWVEALQLMEVGSKWKLFIPSELAYGSQGAGQQIAPYSTLVFEVELLDIV